MSDFEERLTLALHERAEAAPDVPGLAQAARGRARRRRTTGVALVAVTVTGLLAALPPALRLAVGDESSKVAKQPEPEVVGIPADWRFESYRNVELAVPPTWGHGSLHCPGDSDGLVQRPGAITDLRWCEHSAYGVHIGGGLPQNPPPGSTTSATEVAGIAVSVVAPDAKTAETVIGSVREIPGEDYYGCDPARDVPALGTMPPTEFPENGVVTVCWYDLGVEGPNLVASEAFPEDSTFWDDVRSGSPGHGPEAEENCRPESQAALFKSGGEDVAWVHFEGCTGNGIDFGGTTYQLNPKILYWAVPRDGFAVSGAIELPDERRP